MTENNESLLRPVAPDGDWRDNAIIGGRLEDDSMLAMGYLKAAEILVAHWRTGHRNDLLVVPILNLYRHGIELALKDEIREAAARLRADGVTDLDLTPEAYFEETARPPPLTPAAQSETLVPRKSAQLEKWRRPWR